jgi:isoquinoline 1-oxidoreductase beta subunit
MTKHIRELAKFGVENVSRRGVLKGILSTTGLVLAVSVLPQRPALADAPKWGAAGMPHGTVNNPLAFVSITPDGAVAIVCHRSEMGQGVRTGMPLIVADELEADWAKVKVVQATGDETEIRQPGHGRIAFNPPFHIADAPSRRRGPHDARGGRSEALGRSGLGRRSDESRGHSEVHREEARVWRTRRRRQ